MSDFQENKAGVSAGDRVKVKPMEQKFYHMQAFKDDGLDATGFEGIVKEVSCCHNSYAEQSRSQSDHCSDSVCVRALVANTQVLMCDVPGNLLHEAYCNVDATHQLRIRMS